MENKTTYHCHLSIRGFLKMSKPQLRQWARSFRTEGGAMTEEAAREWLLDELSQGHEAYPMGECSNFDWKTGCKGHPDEVAND